MIAASETDLKIFQRMLPVNSPYIPATVWREYRPHSPVIRAYRIAVEMAKVTGALYHELLKDPQPELAVYNSARRWLPEWIRLYEWLQAQSISPILFLRSQVAMLKRRVLPRHLMTQKALAIYDKWLLTVRQMVDTPRQAMEKLAKLEMLKWKDPLQTYISQARYSQDYVAKRMEMSGLSKGAVLYLEGWSLPPAYFMSDVEALDMAQEGTAGPGVWGKVTATVTDMRRLGILTKFSRVFDAV